MDIRNTHAHAFTVINPEKHTRDVLKAAAQEYLRSLKRAWGFRWSREGCVRLERHRQTVRRWNRRCAVRALKYSM